MTFLDLPLHEYLQGSLHEVLQQVYDQPKRCWSKELPSLCKVFTIRQIEMPMAVPLRGK